eukprot:CAMPEP_0172600458 /NCGR_PEP_ID=MMETSP1068-20121228/20655_1 /TAXON_ID=35684 /ORGANISM="Pseudopedinella elastica, Strain CCMP716" /LENGTH=176 /DNA_ID=CAMNT_0013401155 /DNA_START=104 /DNA_END=634 /DNA_ORIENTATION=+
MINSGVALTGIGIYLQLEKLPRGGLEVPSGTLRIGPSTVPNAGLGLFANHYLQAKTRLGTYPGVVCPSAEMWVKTKAMQSPQAKSYVWCLQNGRLIDPTDERGDVPEALNWGPFLSVDTRLARINEPPPGIDGVNVLVEEVGDNVYFITERAIAKGEELFMDYGRTYGRDQYGNGK